MRPDTSRLLVVMRHAKAESYAENDRERHLTDRGRAAAAEAGRHLAELGVVPDHAVVSAAVRTVETWEEVRRASGSTAQPDITEAVYAASPGSILETLRLVPAGARTVLFVGHNPSAGALVHLLDDQEGDPALVAEMLQGFPTAALAVFELPGEWEELDEGSARLTHVRVGRG
jgi:phosphohistidine phosphatase